MVLTKESKQLFVFNCKRCGHCCTELGGVTVLPEDVDRIAIYLDTSRKKVKEQYTYTERNMVFLSQPCPFYEKDKGCTIYIARPKVCHLYPLQVENGRYGAATGCPGAIMIPLGGG